MSTLFLNDWHYTIIVRETDLLANRGFFLLSYLTKNYVIDNSSQIQKEPTFIKKSICFSKKS